MPTHVTEPANWVVNSLMSTQMPHITQHHLSTTVSEQYTTAALPPFSTPWLSFLLTLFHCASSTLFHNPSQSVLYVDIKTKQSSNVFKMCFFFKKKILCCIFNGNEKWIHEMWEKRKKLKSGLSGVVSQRLEGRADGEAAALCWVHNASSVLGRQCLN